MGTFNRRDAVITMAGGLAMSQSALAQPFQEGIEYLTLDQPVTTEAGSRSEEHTSELQSH